MKLNHFILIQINRAYWRCYIDEKGQQVFSKQRAEIIIKGLKKTHYSKIKIACMV